MTTDNTVKSVPAYTTFLATLVAKCAELDVPVTTWELARFVGIQSTVNGHKIYVPKHTGAVGDLETTVPCNLNLRGFKPMPGANGKIQSRFSADIDLIAENLLPALTDSADRLPANKRPVKASK